MASKTILITGGAGFIGSQLAKKLLQKNFSVVVLDNFNTYYDPKFKYSNIRSIQNNSNFYLVKGDLLDGASLKKCFTYPIKTVVHLAAKAGVRPSIASPISYIETNVIGTTKLLECMRDNSVSHIVFGSSSSVYGETNLTPFKETQPTSNHISPYAASKKAAEVICQTYANLYDIQTTILRFFTVYGPHGRPDMAPYLFSEAILNDREVYKYGSGTSKRDYTFVDDITEGILKAIENPFKFEIINLGNNQPVSLNYFISVIEKITKKKALIQQVNVPPGDVSITYASIEKAKKLLHWEPSVNLEKGMNIFINWLQKERL